MNPFRTSVVVGALALVSALGLATVTGGGVPQRPAPPADSTRSVGTALDRGAAAFDDPATPTGVSSGDAEPAALDPEVAAEGRRAAELLADLAATYEHLEDVTVRMGETPNDEQAVAYYTDGEIVIDPAHEAEIEKILAHEIWHVIDWRDNGRIDWGEDLPPSEASDYLRR